MLYFVFVRNIFTIYKEVERCTEHMTNIVLADVADMITNIIITIMTVDVDMTTDTNTGCGEHEQQDENVAVLAYMLDHNKHHALELKEIAKHLREVGKDEAAAQIEKGVEDFEKGNMRLSIALSLVK